MKSLIPAISLTFLFIFEGFYSPGSNNTSLQTANNKMENMTYPVKNINVSINKPVPDVYQFASHPENFPKWVKFVKSISRQEEFWIAETDLGRIKIEFSPKNNFGIIDHHVTLASGETIYNPMRVITNNKGCEFIFTLFRMPGRTEQEFNEDAKAVTTDLQKLKEIMEAK